MTANLFTAFAAAQAEFLHVVREDDSHQGKFAGFPAVIAHVRPILNRHGLMLFQPAQPAEGGICVRTVIAHTSGETYSDDGLFLPAAKHDPQGYGSALSYAKRYGLLSMLGVATADDDGAAALQGLETQKREDAAAAALAAARLSPKQAQIITAIMAKAGHANPDLDDKLEEDYPQHVKAAIKYAVKQSVVDAADAPDVEAAALAGDAGQVDSLLKGGVTAA
jgi:hypothetical protein